MNIPVPLIVEEITEVRQILDCVEQHPENLYLEEIEVFPASSLCETSQVDPVLCRLSDVLVRVQFDAHATLVFSCLLVV